MEDKLDTLFDWQRRLQHFLAEQRPEQELSTQKEQALLLTRAIMHECCELDDELNWKPWKNVHPVNCERLELELADIWLFLVQLTDTLGVTPDHLMQIVQTKHQENIRRQYEDPRYRAGETA
ncbi:MAG: dUTP diphosphatase [Ktedonobacterales bacterium]